MVNYIFESGKAMVILKESELSENGFSVPFEAGSVWVFC